MKYKKYRIVLNKTKMIEQPDFVYDINTGNKIELYQHQLKSVYDMEQFEKKEKIIQTINYIHRPNNTREIQTSIGLFRDIPGYGKTLSLCVLIARDVRDDKIKWDMSVPFSKVKYNNLSECIQVSNHENYIKCDCTIVVCSPNLIHQWKIELKDVG